MFRAKLRMRELRGAAAGAAVGVQAYIERGFAGAGAAEPDTGRACASAAPRTGVSVGPSRPPWRRPPTSLRRRSIASRNGTIPRAERQPRKSDRREFRLERCRPRSKGRGKRAESLSRQRHLRDRPCRCRGCTGEVLAASSANTSPHTGTWRSRLRRWWGDGQQREPLLTPEPTPSSGSRAPAQGSRRGQGPCSAAPRTVVARGERRSALVVQEETSQHVAQLKQGFTQRHHPARRNGNQLQLPNRQAVARPGCHSFRRPCV